MDCPLGGTYRVARGDTLSSIARAYGITEQTLRARNPFVDPARIAPGQVLCVPGEDGQARQTVPRAAGPDQTPPQPPNSRPPQPQPPQPQPPQPQPPQPPSPRPPQPPQPPSPRPPQPPSPRPPQPPNPRPPQLCPPGYRQGTVQGGERFEDLLLRFDVSYRALRAANPSLPDPPSPGQRFCAPPAGSNGCRTYTLNAGDTLERAAARLRTTPGALIRLNPTMAPRDFTRGRVICIE